MRPGGGGDGDNALADDTDANGDAGRGAGRSRMSAKSSFFLEPDAVGSYAGGSSLSSGARIGSPERGEDAAWAGPLRPVEVVP